MSNNMPNMGFLTQESANLPFVSPVGPNVFGSVEQVCVQLTFPHISSLHSPALVDLAFLARI
jgi:hypothetical protein